jgi:Dolichyl-phosphate-mannose-protein mannosyltransferase
VIAHSFGSRCARRWVPAALTLLCLGVAALALWQAARDSPTIDEPVYVTAGVTALSRHDLRLNPQHPPLGKVLAAIAVLPAEPVIPAGRVWRGHHQRVYSRAFLEAARRTGKLREITFLSRLVPILELVATGLVVFAIAKRLAGPAGGVFAAALWLLDPFVLGIGHVDGIDVPFTLVVLLLALALVRWLERRTLARAVPIGLACGAALVARDTGPLVLGVAILTVALLSRELRPPLIVGGLAYGVVWLVYGALDPAFTLHHLNVLPQRYIDGFDALADAHAGPAQAFLLGRHWSSAHWWFWPISMVVKLPATLLAAYALTPFFLRSVPPDARRRVYLALVPSALALALFTLATPVYLGLRYMLPVLALLTVGVAPLVRAPRLLPVALVTGSLLFAVASAPHSMAWTAPPFDPGYRATTDSNLDWGQDVYPLQRWARGKHAWIACFSPKGVGCVEGVPGARRLGKHAGRSRVHGWVAISSTLLNLDGWDPWLRHIKPAGTIDGTVLFYRLPPVASLRATSFRPARPPRAIRHRVCGPSRTRSSTACFRQS